jgi:hypothetical protein
VTLRWPLGRPEPRPAAAAPGVASGGVGVDDATSFVRLPLAPVTPDTFVSPPGNEPGNSAIPSDQTFGRDSESAGARTEYELEAELAASFAILLSSPVWNPHQPRPQRSSVPGDWWLQS